MRVLIVGCGYVGQALAKLYLNQGAAVWALQRHAVNMEGLHNILCDVTSIDPQQLPEVDLVYYLVAPQSSDESAYVDVYDKGIKQVITALTAKSNPKLILCSSTRVYGQCQGEEVDEHSITLPQEPLGNLILKAEHRVLSIANSMVVRFGGIYGPNRVKLLEDIVNNRATLSPTPVYTNRIHLNDCAGILHFLAKIQEPASIFLGVDSEPVLYNDMIKWLAAELNAPEPVIGEKPPQRLINSNKRCLNHKIISYGYQFQYPTFREGYRSILEQR